ncbi:protein tyrosine phosphatase family protein [Ferrimonas balearica]|uniref:protein tyrosine phosphatase family protein n=1 Tax=Ferrimonas balearica TaxID=44012 RepID=UPI001C9A26EF|nr:protein tyrosine phosphatase family protein [Ferrimonas balearica]MBY5994167.1 protein tyrosine phosphatase family protein [Ferrimonas balearica]
MKHLMWLLLLTPTLALANLKPDALPAIKAIQVNDDRVVTAGLPTAEQLTALPEAGIAVVINLIPRDHAHRLAGEAELATQAGLTYYQIDVDWQAPKAEDLARFQSLMDQHRQSGLLVHCMANYRASAFYYLYRALEDGEPTPELLAPWGDLEASLAEYPQWRDFMDNTLSKQ